MDAASPNTEAFLVLLAALASMFSCRMLQSINRISQLCNLSESSACSLRNVMTYNNEEVSVALSFLSFIFFVLRYLHDHAHRVS